MAALGGDPTDDIYKNFYEPRLKKLGLTRDQLQDQSLAELQSSLTTINHAIEHPESFGVVNMEMAAKAGNIVGLISTQQNAHIQVGILPVLLELKAFILERINTLRPAAQVRDFRQEVINTVTDPEMRDHLLKALDERAAKEQAYSSKIEEEAEKNTELLRELSHLRELMSVKFESRLNNLEDLTKRIDSEKTSKFEAVTITTTILAALGGLAGLILAIVRWTTG
ncbi:hypothetical protein ACRJ4W_54820 [Streptomyces sp. GLT-R25]